MDFAQVRRIFDVGSRHLDSLDGNSVGEARVACRCIGYDEGEVVTIYSVKNVVYDSNRCY